MNKIITAGAVAAGLALAGCTQTSTMRTSQNTAIISTNAAPICGGTGAARAAQNQAAVETIKAGYDRYVIEGAAAANNVRMAQMPGTFNTVGSTTYGGGFNATTTYTPGPIMMAGSHDQSVAVRMFKEGEPGSANAISAREVLGPDWQETVKKGVHTCA